MTESLLVALGASVHLRDVGPSMRMVPPNAVGLTLGKYKGRGDWHRLTRCRLLCNFAVWCFVRAALLFQNSWCGMFKGYGELRKGTACSLFFPFPPLFIPMQASEVLNPQENEGSLLISKAATCVERVVHGGNDSRKALLMKQRHWLRTEEDDAGSWW